MKCWYRSSDFYWKWVKVLKKESCGVGGRVEGGTNSHHPTLQNQLFRQLQRSAPHQLIVWYLEDTWPLSDSPGQVRPLNPITLVYPRPWAEQSCFSVAGLVCWWQWVITSSDRPATAVHNSATFHPYHHHLWLRVSIAAVLQASVTPWYMSCQRSPQSLHDLLQ